MIECCRTRIYFKPVTASPCFIIFVRIGNFSVVSKSDYRLVAGCLVYFSLKLFRESLFMLLFAVIQCIALNRSFVYLLSFQSGNDQPAGDWFP